MAMFALTFDDGPDPRWTPAVLDALAAARAAATFFVLAPRAAEHPGLVARARAAIQTRVAIADAALQARR